MRLALAHSTVSFPFFHLHSQNEGQSLGFEDAFLLKNEITLLVLSHLFCLALSYKYNYLDGLRKIKRNINYLGTFETIAASSVVPCNMNTQIMANESTNCRLMNEFTIFFVIIVLGVVGRGGGSTIVLKWFQKTFFLVVIVSFTSIVSSSMCGDVSCGHFSSYLTLTLNVVTFS